MIALCLGSLILNGSAQTAETAAAVVSKMLAKYAAAQSIVGKVKYNVAGTNLGVDTEFQFEKPNRLYILQSRRSSEPKQWLVVCDGKNFGYPLPESIDDGGKKRFYETAVVNGRPIDLREIYRVVASCIGDRNIGLDVAISRLENLKFLKNQWATMAYAPEQSGESSLRRIVGSWRENASSPSSGSYEIFITSDGDLKKYVLRQTLMPDKNIGPQLIESVWTIDLQVNAKCDANLFLLK